MPNLMPSSPNRCSWLLIGALLGPLCRHPAAVFPPCRPLRRCVKPNMSTALIPSAIGLHGVRKRIFAEKTEENQYHHRDSAGHVAKDYAPPSIRPLKKASVLQFESRLSGERIKS
nr:uncharacterized protein LOC127340791 [Lolium perenne]